MRKNIPHISVMVITYNQEDVISRAIDSLLVQKEYIYEVCISDDGSHDKTWDILQDYSKQYPGLFKLNRNEPNLCIFENIEKVWTMPSGDIAYMLAGDDTVGPNWFRSVIELIEKNNLDYKNEKFLIAGNFQCVYPNGDSITYKKNKNITLNTSAIRLYERGVVGPRSNTYSINVLRQFEKVSQGRSYIAENAQDCQPYLFSDKFYYINEVGNVYYAGIGVSTSITDERRKQHEQSMIYAFDFLKKKGVKLKRNDLKMPVYNIAQKNKRWNPSINNFIRFIWLYIQVFDLPLYLHSINFKGKLFSIARRLPHKKSINW